VVILPRGGSAGPRTRTASIRPPAPPFLGPRRDRLQVGPSLPAQRRRPPGERLVRLALAGSLEDPGHLGQQIGPAARELAQHGPRGGFLVAVQLAPPGTTARLAVKLGDEETVSLRALIDHTF